MIMYCTFPIQPFICEDSDQLLEFMRSSEPDEDIPEPPEDEDDKDEVRRFRRRPIIGQKVKYTFNELLKLYKTCTIFNRVKMNKGAIKLQPIV